MTVGIALGAGGPLGWAFHLGVLDGIRDALGVEPADAQRVVGTSAGGAIAASLLSGADSETVLASISQPMSEADQAEMRAAMSSRKRGWRRLLIRPQAPLTALRRLPFAPVTAAVGLMPGGVFPTYPLRRFPVDPDATWPASLWLPSVRMDTGELTVFGRDRTDVDIRDALEATSAVPGMFRPKRIDGVAHVDGAVASATHADLLADDGHDLVVVSSVMTRPGRGPIKIRARHQLRQEIASLERAGTRAVVIEPSPEVIELARGWPRTGGERGPEIVAAATKQTIDQLRR
ncbi:MAG: patatin-like phospholipase family protein [Actinomycetota bacterium]